MTAKDFFGVPLGLQPVLYWLDLNKRISLRMIELTSGLAVWLNDGLCCIPPT